MSKYPRGLSYDTERGHFRIQLHSRHTRPGELYRERLPEGTTRRQAEAYLSRIREADRMGELLWPRERSSAPEMPPALPSVGQFATDTYLPYCATRNAAKTLRAKQQALQASAPWFWEVGIDEVDLALVHRYQIERKAEGVRARTVNMQWETVRHLLAYAHKLGLISKPPPLVDPLPTRDKKAAQWLSVEEATRALEHAAERGAVWHALTLFLLSTGARWGETRQLRWDDLDLEAGIVHLRAESAKHGRPRDLPLLPELIEALEALPRGHDQVFARRHIRTEEWIELQEDARVLGGKYPWEGKDGDLRVGPHVFRHTFATWRLRRGASESQVSTLLGHASIQLTADVYGHVRASELGGVVEDAPRPQVRRLRVVGDE